MTNKRKIADQVLYIIAGGDIDNSFPVQAPDIYAALEQKINAKFRMRQFETFNIGETIPDGLCYATYTGIAVTESGDLSKSILPVMPVSLPRNMGIFDIRHGDNSFIPLQPGQRSLLKADTLLNNLLNQVGYEPKGMTIYYTQNILLLGYTAVDMDLIVSDLSILSETDPLPIPADYEDALVNELVQMFGKVQPETGIVNPFTNAQQQPNK